MKHYRTAKNGESHGAAAGKGVEQMQKETARLQEAIDRIQEENAKHQHLLNLVKEEASQTEMSLRDEIRCLQMEKRKVADVLVMYKCYELLCTLTRFKAGLI